MLMRLVAAAILICFTGCSLVDPAQLTESYAVATPDPAAARDFAVAAIYQMAKDGEEGKLASQLDQARQAALAAPSPGASVSAYPELPTAPPTATPTPSPTPVPTGAGAGNAAGSGATSSAGSAATASGNATASASAGATASASATATTIPTATPTPRIPVDPALALALYKVDPNTYRQTFVENYPIDESGAQHDYGDRLTRARLTKDRTRFPIVAIATIAGGGDPTAMVRMLAATAAASGDIAAQYADADAYVASKNPDGFVAGLEALPMGIRLRVASTSHWCTVRPKAILAKPSADTELLAMQRVIDNVVSSCRPAKLARRRRSGQDHGKTKTSHTRSKFKKP